MAYAYVITFTNLISKQVTGGNKMNRVAQEKEIKAIKRRVAVVLLIMGSFLLTGISYGIYSIMMLNLHI